MYRTYRTEAVVLDATNIGEANRFVYLLTEELGLVGAMAQGIRRLQSKMRLHTESGTLGRFSLVRGREVWRLTNAVAIASFGAVLSERGLLPVAARLTALVRRLVPGEEPNPVLYRTVRDALDAMTRAPSAAIPAIERVAVARILHALGYFSAPQEGASHLTSPQYDEAVLAWAAAEARPLVAMINQSLRESQL